jgi:DNA-binding CsgD family transcriptional regulator
MTQILRHPSAKYVQDIQRICQPLQQLLDIRFFDYGKFLPNGDLIVLYNDPEYVQFYLTHPIYKKNKPTLLKKPGKYLWNSYIDPDFLADAKKKFGYDHGMTILIDQDGYQEVFNFATTSENAKIYDFYFNQPQLLSQFMDYFKDKTKEIIKAIARSPIILEKIPQETIEFIKPDAFAKLSKALGNEDADYMMVKNKKIPLTEREAQSLTLLAQGKRTKDIAKVLEISPRTVDIYLNKIRKKIGIKNRFELLNLWNQHRLLAHHQS